MATLRWTGRAEPVAQVLSFTAGGTIGTETFSIIFYHDSVEVGRVSYTAASGEDADDVAAGLVAAWNASSKPRTSGITASDQTAVTTGMLYLTADTPGTPFDEDTAGSTHINSAATGSATLTKASITANAGPNVWGAAANYEDNAGGTPAAPDEDDTVYIQGGPSILYELDSISTITSPFAHVYIDASFGPSTIGLPDENSLGYREFLNRHLQLSATAVTIGRGNGSGSGRMRLDMLADASTITVHGTGGAIDTGRAALQIINTAASSALDIRGGTVEVGREGGAASVLTGSTITVNGGSLSIWNPTTIGATLTATVFTGTLTLEPSSTANVTVVDGTFQMLKGCTVSGTVTVSGSGVVLCGASGASPDIGTLVMTSEDATFDASEAVGTLTITTASGAVLGTIINPNLKISNSSIPAAKRVVMSNG